MNTKVKGYILAVIAAATYGMNPLFALPLYQAGMDPDSVLFFRYMLAIPILGIMHKERGRNFKLKKRELLLLIATGLLVAVSSLTLFQSYNYMDVSIASTLLFVYPLMVALIMMIGFKEKMTWQTMLCLLLVILGIGLLYKGSDGSTLSIWGCLLVLVSATSYALYMVLINKSILRQIATLKITFYVLLFGLSLFLVRTDFGQSLIVPQYWYLWANLLALAIFPTVISFLCTTSAINSIGSTPTAILGALEPVTAIFFGIAIFGEVLTPRLIAGIILIILAVTFVVAAAHLETYIVRLRKLFPRLPLKKK
ncbi:DMT family transporter [Massilibacteroides vaginae]|uniref:DMT family transporter n=1 Tax=Massilibacteroides vaginae TaxID=1673718 RepID=UPI000A1CA4E3|nr:DMT family transporter [Massilibacteroides vaginae]